MKILENRIDPETLEPKIAQSAMGAAETCNLMALSSLKAKDRDREKVLHFWKAGIVGARTLQNQSLFD
jgi:hypothetical protein